MVVVVVVVGRGQICRVNIQKFSKVATRTGVGNPPILRTDASPLDEEWIQRLKEEYHCLIHYVKMGKELGNDWFRYNY